MEDLIEALQIFLTYSNVNCPTHCEHNVMYIMGVNPIDVSGKDTAKLEKLGFFVPEEDGEWFISYKFGSA